MSLHDAQSKLYYLPNASRHGQGSQRIRGAMDSKEHAAGTVLTSMLAAVSMLLNIPF